MYILCTLRSSTALFPNNSHEHARKGITDTHTHTLSQDCHLLICAPKTYPRLCTIPTWQRQRTPSLRWRQPRAHHAPSSIPTTPTSPTGSGSRVGVTNFLEEGVLKGRTASTPPQPLGAFVVFPYDEIERIALPRGLLVEHVHRLPQQCWRDPVRTRRILCVCVCVCVCVYGS